MKKISFANTARFVAIFPVAIGIACHALAVPFVPAGALNAGRGDHTATLLADGRVLVAGGVDTGNNSIPFCELYNPTAGTWTLTSPMSSPRVGHTATLLPNGKVLVTGGYSAAAGRLASAESYDPVTGLWTITMPMTTARTAHTATLLTNGMVLVTGGYGGASGWLASAEMFNPNTGVWCTVAPLQTARSLHAATLLADGRVLVTGGYSINGVILSSAEIYDSVNVCWLALPNLIHPRCNHSATLLANGTVLVAGGQNNNADLASAELYAPAVGGWLTTSPMAVARQGACATLLSDGNVLITGGFNTTSRFLPTAEIYDPSSGTWLFSPPMLNPCSGHRATLLANGKVLLTGGYNDTGCLSATALYGCLVSFDVAGGTLATATKTYYTGEVYGTLPVPARTSYLFAGWWTGLGGAGIRATDTAFLASVFDHTLYAKWTGPVTVSTPVPVPYTWLAQYPVAGQSAADYETAARTDSDGDGQAAWQEYLAGSVPTNAHSFFQAGIAVSNGMPRLTWSPDLGSARVYLFEGKTNLTDSAWGTTNAGSRFFRAKVSMP